LKRKIQIKRDTTNQNERRIAEQKLIESFLLRKIKALSLKITELEETITKQQHKIKSLEEKGYYINTDKFPLLEVFLRFMQQKSRSKNLVFCNELKVFFCQLYSRSPASFPLLKTLLKYVPAVATVQQWKREKKSSVLFSTSFQEIELAQACESIKKYYRSVGYYGPLFLAEDQTRILSKLAISFHNYKMLGLTEEVQIETFEDVKKSFLRSLAKSMYLYIVSPVDKKYNVRVVAAVPSTNDINADDIVHRWKLIRKHFLPEYDVLSVGADGDPKVTLL